MVRISLKNLFSFIVADPLYHPVQGGEGSMDPTAVFTTCSFDKFGRMSEIQPADNSLSVPLLAGRDRRGRHVMVLGEKDLMDITSPGFIQKTKEKRETRRLRIQWAAAAIFTLICLLAIGIVICHWYGLLN